MIINLEPLKSSNSSVVPCINYNAASTPNTNFNPLIGFSNNNIQTIIKNWGILFPLWKENLPNSMNNLKIDIIITIKEISVCSIN
jgi:hypothetical protein